MGLSNAARLKDLRQYAATSEGSATAYQLKDYNEGTDKWLSILSKKVSTKVCGLDRVSWIF